MANPRGQQRDKPYRDALRMEAKLAEDGEETPAKKGSLRWIARQQLIRAGEDTSAAKEIADRLDGKVAQPTGGDEELGPVRHEISWKQPLSKSTTPPENSSNPSTTEQNDLPVL